MDTVLVRIPASPELVGTVRLVASGLGARLGFTIDDIDDLKIAVDEMCAYLTGPRGRYGMLEISFEVEEERVTITGTVRLSTPQRLKKLSDLSRVILDTVVDHASLEHESNQDGVTTAASITLIKSRRAGGNASR